MVVRLSPSFHMTHLVEFELKFPILSMFSGLASSPSGSTFAGACPCRQCDAHRSVAAVRLTVGVYMCVCADDPVTDLFTLQTLAVQQYTLDPRSWFPYDRVASATTSALSSLLGSSTEVEPTPRPASSPVGAGRARGSVGGGAVLTPMTFSLGGDSVPLPPAPSPPRDALRPAAMLTRRSTEDLDAAATRDADARTSPAVNDLAVLSPLPPPPPPPQPLPPLLQQQQPSGGAVLTPHTLFAAQLGGAADSVVTGGGGVAMSHAPPLNPIEQLMTKGALLASSTGGHQAAGHPRVAVTSVADLEAAALAGAAPVAVAAAASAAASGGGGAAAAPPLPPPSTAASGGSGGAAAAASTASAGGGGGGGGKGGGKGGGGGGGRGGGAGAGAGAGTGASAAAATPPAVAPAAVALGPLATASVADIVEALSKPLENRLRSAVNNGVVPKLTNAMRESVTEAFRVAFLETLVPATEKGLQEMFVQAGRTFENGVGRILEQVRATLTL